MKNIIIILIIILSAATIAFAQNVNQQKLEFAKSFEQSGDFETAARLYKELYDSNPKNKTYFNGIVNNLKALSKFSELLPYVEKQIKIKKSTELLSLFGELLWETGTPDKANQAWQNALSLIPNLPQTYSQVAESQISVQQYKKAISTFESGRDRIGNDKLFADELSRLFIATGNYSRGSEEVLVLFSATRNLALAQGRLSALMTSAEAMKHIKSVLEDKRSSFDKNPIFLKLYAWFLRSINDLEDAFQLYKQIDALMNAKGREIINFANDSRKDGQFDIALKAYENVISMGKNSRYLSSALYGYPRTLEQKLLSGKNISEESARNIIEQYRNIVLQFPKNTNSAEAAYRIALISVEYLNDLNLAKKELNELVTKFPGIRTSAKALNMLGNIYLMEDRLDEAGNYYNKVISKFIKISIEDVENAKFHLAEIEFFRGNIDSSKSLFGDLAAKTKTNIANDALQKVILIEQNKELIKALNIYAQAEMREKQKRINESIKLYLDASEFSAGSDLAQRSLIKAAKLEFNRGRFDSSLRHLNYLIENYPKAINLDLANLIAGNCYAALKNKELAIKSYNNILINHTRSIYLQQARDKIRALRSSNKM